MPYQERLLRGRYKTIAEIGRGGMAVVHFAQDQRIGSYWAVKQVRNTSSLEFDAFLKEVELLALLNHSGIPRIVDRIEAGSDYFVVMDFISGTSLTKIVQAEGPQPERTVIDWSLQLCSIFEYLHSADPSVGKRPIVYRDLKPNNVMLTPAGEIKLVDFGIATEYTPGEKMNSNSLGTKGYAAPEQYGRKENYLDACSDIYSLGATMFYLTTGATPAEPPKGVPTVRSKNPLLSDAFEYVVAKCTADDRANRYQSFAEVRADLENIERLSGIYRAKMKRRLVLFWSSLALGLVFLLASLVGWRGMQATRESRFQAAYQSAAAHARQGDHVSAAQYYAQALQVKPDDRDTHVLLFNALLPQNGEENANVKTMSAIDEMRKSYLDNPASPMYNDPQLCYLVLRRCIEVADDARYAQAALDYIEVIRQSREFQQGTLVFADLHSLEVMASFQSQNSLNADYALFNQTLLEFESYTDRGELAPSERLDNYHLLIQMYATYPRQLENAVARAYQIGGKARTLLEESTLEEIAGFNNMVSLYKLVAASQYNGAQLLEQDAEQEQAYKNSIEWFDYLEDLSVSLDESMALKRANAHKGVFDLYNQPQGQPSADALWHLQRSIELYEGILADDPQSFLAWVYLAHACYDREALAPQDQQDHTQTLRAYAEAKKLAHTDNTIPVASVMQFSSLTKLLQNAGLEV